MDQKQSEALLAALLEGRLPDENGRFGPFGGRYVPETLMPAIARLEHGPKGANPRFVVTNLKGDGTELYDRVYCARGEMENRIKEQQLQLFADRTSCHRWWPNQFRLLLASLVGTFGGIWLMQIGIAYTDSAVASALHSTTPLFTLPIAYFISRERIGPRVAAASCLAVAGVVVLLLG